MGLDIKTPKGIESRKQEEYMMKIISNNWKINYIETNKDIDAAADGFLIKNNNIYCVYENKCRNLSVDELEKHGSWLITFSKLEKCRTISKLLKIKFIGFLYLIKDDIIMYWDICDEKGNYLFEFEHYESETQRTINGGITIRDNAYLPVEYGKFVQKLEKGI